MFLSGIRGKAELGKDSRILDKSCTSTTLESPCEFHVGSTRLFSSIFRLPNRVRFFYGSTCCSCVANPKEKVDILEYEATFICMLDCSGKSSIVINYLVHNIGMGIL